MRASSAKKSRCYKYAAIILLAVFLVSFSLIAIDLYDKNHGKFPTQPTVEQYIERDGVKYELKKNVEAFLVIGLDKMSDYDGVSDSYNNDKQADFIMLFVLDNKNKTVTPIHINRDTMAEMNVLGLNGNPVGSVTKQLALSYNYGNGGKISCRNTLDAVSELLLGVKINHYMSVTMDAVPIYNDLVGGVTLEVLDDFTGIDDALVKGQTVTLSGSQALTYVRTREGLEDDTNVARMIRQKQYLTALREKTVEKLDSDTQFAAELTVKMSDYLISDRSVTQMQELLNKFSSYEFTDTLDLEGENKVGEKFMEFYPDEDSILDTVIKAFYQVSDK